MKFGTYAGRAVLTAVDVVNTDDVAHGVDRLDSGPTLAELLTRRGWVVDKPISGRQLPRLRVLRRQLREIFETDSLPDIVSKLNALLSDHGACPQLTDHDGAWHWHYQPPGTTLADRVATSCAAALLEVIARDGHAGRFRTCAADGCRNVFVDASRNGKRLFCDNRTCGNRTHAAAYRARQADRSAMS